MTRVFRSMSLIVLATGIAVCQSFEVASIKPSDPLASGVHINVSPGGLFTATNVTLKILIQNAWDVRDFQISGGPGWIDTEKYDITARGDSPGVSEDEIRKMTEVQRNKIEQEFLMKVQTLLADRFQLKVHREMKELPVYALIVAKGGPKIEPATEDGGPGGRLSMRRGSAGAEVTGQKALLVQLARLISDQVGRTVLDKTGLKGSYDFKMSFAPDSGLAQQPPGDFNGPSIFTAVQEQLGLKLDAQKGSVEVLVIDSARKASAN